MESSSQTLKQKAYHELKEFLVTALYLWVVFGLLELHKSMILAEHHIDFAYHGFALINALALGKFIPVAKDLGLGKRLNHAPLIYSTLLKSAQFTVVLACLEILEDAAIGLYRGSSIQQSIADIGGGSARAIVILSLLMFAFFVAFIGYGELQRVLGKGKLEQIFFSPRPFVKLSEAET
jgi:hypothetical protein